ncbi:hypothetical protein SO802_002985 [Lithocarpus litseifolius]|uniref:Maturase K n=1 Tax=Lithocarpus litseifolius TaxID=425828 RepID=A0AAW2E455_9ROSI
MALILEEIWCLRNVELHLKNHIDLTNSIQLIQRRYQEYLAVCLVTPTKPKQQGSSYWIPPPPRHIKIKTDAALSSSGSALAVIARDNRGTICNAWNKKVFQFCTTLLLELL